MSLQKPNELPDPHYILEYIGVRNSVRFCGEGEMAKNKAKSEVVAWKTGRAYCAEHLETELNNMTKNGWIVRDIFKHKSDEFVVVGFRVERVDG
jgi:hypothetical protein